MSASESSPGAGCPIQGCSGDLYLTVTSCTPLYRVEPPWPGANVASWGWEVVCSEGHTVWTHPDQVRADNAAGLTDDDETGDYAPVFRMACLPTPSERPA